MTSPFQMYLLPVVFPRSIRDGLHLAAEKELIFIKVLDDKTLTFTVCYEGGVHLHISIALKILFRVGTVGKYEAGAALVFHPCTWDPVTHIPPCVWARNSQPPLSQGVVSQRVHLVFHLGAAAAPAAVQVVN